MIVKVIDVVAWFGVPGGAPPPGASKSADWKLNWKPICESCFNEAALSMLEKSKVATESFMFLVILFIFKLLAFYIIELKLFM